MGTPASRVVALIGSLAFACSAWADPPPDSDFEWATIGSAWNRPTRPDEVPWYADKKLGRVTHRYRMSTTEVTVGQWLDFVRAYGPHWEGDPDDTDLTSLWIWFDGENYHADAGREKWPVQATFFNAMRYANWLHNDKGSEKSDFEAGAYDLSSFWRDENGFWHGQESRAEGSRFWIPSRDEWTKAGYYDPNRHGEGEAGYWRFNHRSDEQPISGLPGNGGETNAGLNGYPDFGMDILSYPWTQSPWGLYDMTGGEWEWTETPYVAFGG